MLEDVRMREGRVCKGAPHPGRRTAARDRLKLGASHTKTLRTAIRGYGNLIAL